MKKILLSALAITGVSQAMAISINFDEFGMGPTLFNSTDPVREEYAGMGVHFKGPGDFDGGAILEDSSFAVKAHSGTNFLAFNRNGTDGVKMLSGGHPFDPESILFDNAISDFSIWATSNTTAGLFVVAAYDSNDTFLGVNAFLSSANQWSQIGFSSGSSNISKIVLTEASNASVFMYDDLSAVPEPASLAVLGLGAAALIRRRRRS